MSTFTLIQAMRRHTDLPIIAAGGIMDGAGINCVMNLAQTARSWERRFCSARNRPRMPAIVRPSKARLTG